MSVPSAPGTGIASAWGMLLQTLPNGFPVQLHQLPSNQHGLESPGPSIFYPFHPGGCVGLIFIFPMIHEVKHLYICLLAIRIPLLRTVSSNLFY